MNLFNLAKRGTLSGLVSMVLNVIVYLVATSLLAVDTEVSLPNGERLDLMAVCAASFIPGVVGSLLLFGLSKISKHDLLIFNLLAVVVLLGSMIPVFSSGLSSGYSILLAVLHLIPALVIVYFLNKSKAQV
jgi:hypothetical protein|tara:strand:- start:435 stop:827 length:393 start_codon:yes stop_codon:yes gene_type:complete